MNELLESERADTRLLCLSLEALDRYLRYDMNVTMPGDEKIRDYFCSLKGDDNLQSLSNHANY